MNKELKNIHFMGIRGSGASFAASIALKEGFKVSGCDQGKSNEYVKFLLDQRVSIDSGHHPSHLSKIDMLVVSPAIEQLDPTNLELQEARVKAIPILTWQRFVGEYLMKDKFVIAVAGTHGKGTTASMIGLILEEALFDPTVGLGSVVPKWKRNFRVGKGKYFVIEADEFNNNFLNFSPNAVCITNIEMDHPEFFADIGAVIESFRSFISKMKKDSRSVLILNKDDAYSQELINSFTKERKIFSLITQKITKLFNFRFFSFYSKIKELKINFSEFSLLDKEASFHGANLLTTHRGIAFDLTSDKYSEINPVSLGRYQIPIFGKHNAYNTLAALSMVFSIERPTKQLCEASKKALSYFRGTERRFEIKGEFNGVTIIDDYAHHPTEIKATLLASKDRFPLKRIWAVFQPHMFTRTKYLFKDFVRLFKEGMAQEVIITDIFASREKNVGLVSSESLVRAVGSDKVKYIAQLSDVVKYLKRQVKSGDVVVVMGAGDVNKVSEELLESL